MKAEDLLISTKFAPPRIGPRHVLRRNLLDQLQRSERSNLVLVTGAPGFGKTILLAQWRQALLKSGADVAWLSLSGEDKQPSNFCSYLLAALHRLGVPVETDMLLEGDGTISMDAAVAVAVNGASAVAKDLYLIVDDYHYIDDPWAHRLMQKLLDHCPGNLHIAIASRASPPLNVSRLRVSGQLSELGFGELPFDLQESQAFFEQNLPGVKLSIDELQLIHDLTGGWPASLQLLAIVLKTRPKTRAMLRDLRWKLSDLQTYLAEDVVANLPEELVTFIEQISICRRFNVELAVAVTDNANAAALVQRIEEENLFIYRVESEDRLPWYRFHPLFGEFLAARVARLGEEAVQDLHARASRWFSDHGFLIEAVRHATHGGDLEFALEAIEKAGPESWDLGFVGPLLNLLERLPQEVLLAKPRLFLVGCLTVAMTAQPAKAERWIARIPESGALRDPQASAEVAVAVATLAWRRDDTSRVLDLLEPLGSVRHENRFFHYIHAAALVAAYGAAGRYADAHKVLDEALATADSQNSNLVASIEQARASTLLIEGKVTAAANLGADILARSEAAQGRHSVNANLCAAILGDAYYELDRIDDAREVIANRPRILEWAPPEVMVRAAVCRARLDFLQESADAALAFLTSYATHYQSLGLDRPQAYMLAEQVKILLDTGRRKRANELILQLREFAVRHRNTTGFLAEIPAIVESARARAFLAESRTEDALSSLQIVRDFAEKFGRRRMLVRTDLQSSMILARTKRGQEAVEFASRAIRSGFRLGLVRTFLDERNAVATLQGLSPALDERLDEAEIAYLKDLHGRCADSRPRLRKADHASTDDEHINLTPREAEILALICHAMPNKRIALALDITLETVKWNVKNILAKLGVSNRYDAITRARESGLVK